VRGEYDKGLTRLQSELYSTNTEATHLRKEYDTLRLHSTACERRISELEALLTTSRNEETRLAGVENQHRSTTDSLAVLKEQLAAVSAAKALADGVVQGLQEQVKRDGAVVANNEERNREHGKGQQQLQLAARFCC
jgi:chromosome segregation ATPase